MKASIFGAFALFAVALVGCMDADPPAKSGECDNLVTVTSGGHSDSPFVEAACNNDLDEVKRLLEEGVSIDVQDEKGFTALMCAASYYYEELEIYLLEQGANTEKRDNYGFTALLRNAVYGEIEEELVSAKILLDYGADPDARDKDGFTGLLYASLFDYPEMVGLLLQYDADPDCRDAWGWTPLMAASQEGYQPIVMDLLLHQATVNTWDVFLWTPLMYAADYCELGIVKLLLDHDAVAIFVNEDEQTALDIAQASDCVAVVIYLEESGSP